MSLVNGPFGFQASYHPSGYIRPARHIGLIPSLTNVNIFNGQPVFLGIGTGAAVNGVTIATGVSYLAPVTTSTQDFLGIFAGCEYFDALGKPTESSYWPANQAIQAGTVVTAFVHEDPFTVFEVQADGAVTVSSNGVSQIDGKQVVISNFAAGVAVGGGVGQSQATISATPIATGSQGQFYVRGLSPSVLNQSAADAYPIFQVVMARSHFQANKVSI